MPTTCLAALIKRLRGIWERYRLRAEAAQNRRDDGHGRVYAWGQGTKETQTAQGHRRSTKEIRASVRIAGSRWCQPRAQGLQTSAKAVSPQPSSGTGHPESIRESGQCNDARIMHTLSDDKKDGYEIGILSLYPRYPEKEHSQTTFFQSNKAPEQREDLIRGKS